MSSDQDFWRDSSNFLSDAEYSVKTKSIMDGLSNNPPKKKPFLKVDFETAWYNINILPVINIWFPQDNFEISFYWIAFGLIFEFRRN